MKKMIKTAAVIMSTIMVFSMTACAKKADPKEVFDAAVKKNSELTSLDMDTTMKMTMTQGEETMDITVDMNMKMSNMNEDSMQYLADTKTSLMGQSMDARIFYKDGYYYMDGMGQKIKYPMDLTELMESVKQSTESTNLQSEQMKEITMAKEGTAQSLLLPLTRKNECLFIGSYGQHERNGHNGRYGDDLQRGQRNLYCKQRRILHRHDNEDECGYGNGRRVYFHGPGFNR